MKAAPRQEASSGDSDGKWLESKRATNQQAACEEMLTMILVIIFEFSGFNC